MEKNQGIRELPRKVQGLHVFPDIILRSWGLNKIPKFKGLREIPGYKHCNIYITYIV